MGRRFGTRRAWAALVVAIVASLVGVSPTAPASAAVPALRAEAVVTGGNHSCALMEDDSTRCWGLGLLSLGYPGHGSVGDDEVPAEVGPLDLGAGRRVVSLGAGISHTCAVLDDGVVRCWGQDEDGKLGNSTAPEQGDPATAPPVDLGPAAVSVDASIDHSCAVLVGGSLRCWGRSRSGDLGLASTLTVGDDEAVSSVPPIDLGAGRTVTSVAVGLAHTCALLDDGTVRCWGEASSGALGLGNLDDIGDDEHPGDVPAVDLGPGRTAVALAAGYFHTCAMLDDGAVRCWGWGEYGALGTASTAIVGDDESPAAVPPVDLGAGRVAVAIGAGGSHTCAVLDDGSLRCWGQNDKGQLGYASTATVGDDESPASVGPVDLGAGRTAVAVDAGERHTCAVLDDGSVRCWGEGRAGILGYGNTADIGDDEAPGTAGPVDLGSASIAELAVSVTVEPAEAHVGETVDVHVTVRNTGGVPLTGVDIALPSAPGCAGPTSDLGIRASTTVDCTRALTESDLGPLALAPTATSEQTPDPVAADPVIVSVLDAPSGLEGTVRDSVSGDPVPGAFVAALRTSDYRLEGGAVADDRGRYRVEVDPGQYLLYLLDPTGGHTAAIADNPTVRVVAAHELGLADVAMTPTRGAIEGVVTGDDTGRPVPGALALVLDRGGMVERVSTADLSGRYAVEGLRQGDHLVGFVDPNGVRQIRFHAGSTSVPGATPVAVVAGGRTTLDAPLPRQDSEGAWDAVTGTIREVGTGVPLPGTVVVALRASDYRFVRATTADGAGRYRLVLPPVPHVLAFLDPEGRHGSQWFDGRPTTALGEADPIAPPAVADAALAPRLGSIQGVITDDPAGTPVPGAWAVAIGPTGVGGAAATDQDGVYAIDDLTPGTYRVTVVDPNGGRAQEYVDGQVDYASADLIEVAAGRSASADAAIARPDVPLAMGGVGNAIGNDPEQWSSPGYERPYFWLNVAGPRATKVNGDRYTAGDCSGSYSGCAGGANLDYAEEGYVYRVSVGEEAAAEDLHVQVFDPAFTDVGNTCATGGNLPRAGTTWTAQAARLVTQGAPPDAVTRYAAGNNQWCVADADYGGNDVETTYLVRGPDGTPEAPLDNPVVCAVTFGDYDESVYPLLDQADGYRDGPIGPEHLRFVDHFRRWADVCRVPAAQVVAGDYLLQVTTTADQSNPPASLSLFDPTVATGGHNKYAVRAGAGTPGAAGFADGVRVAADGRLPIYVNQAGAGTTTGVSLARVPSRYAGRTLELELFDVADGANATLTIAAPPDRTGSPLPPCTFTRDAPTPVATTSATCTLAGLTNALYNGRTLTARVPLPADYRCETRSDDGCRFRLRLDFGAGAPTDQTTWTARIR